MKLRELRGLIYSQYDSESDLSRILGWPKQKLNKMTNGAVEPNLMELNDLAKALNTGVEELAQIFLRYKSPNEQPKTSKDKAS